MDRRDDDETVEMTGASAWRVRVNGVPGEANAVDRIAVTGARSRWTIQTADAAGAVDSGSREVAGYLRRVAGEKQRLARRRIVRPAPKPETTRPAPPPGEFVPCPRCLGAAWPDCEACAGAGMMSAADAARWTTERLD